MSCASWPRRARSHSCRLTQIPMTTGVNQGLSDAAPTLRRTALRGFVLTSLDYPGSIGERDRTRPDMQRK